MSSKKEHVGTILGRTICQKKWLSIGIAAAVCTAVIFSLFPPLILGKIVDSITAGKQTAFWMVLAYMGLIALTGLMESARESLLTVFGQKITHALRSSLIEKFTRLTADGLNHQEPGAVVSRFVGDVDTVEELFTSGIISMFADACSIISILVVIWFNNKGLAIVLVVILPFLFWFTRHVQKNMLAAQIQNRRAVSRVSGHVPETLHNIRTIHCLGKERYMEERYDTYIGESYQAIEKTNFYDAVYSPVILILNAIVVAVVMLFSASGKKTVLTLFGMSAGTAVAVMNYVSQIFTPVESLGMEIQTIQSALAGVHRINEFLDQPELPEKQPVEKKSQKADAPFVSIKNVSFGYDDRLVLENLNFQVNTGEQVTLAGRTGAGKSTIFKLLLGLYRPSKGTVLIDGMPAADIPEKTKRKLFGCVEQSFHMVPGTVKDQITLFDENITMEDVKAAAQLTGLADTIEELEKGYDTICTPELFSQGQWQLLSIARAAAASPKLLLLDEITANLDAETEKEVLQALRRISENRTVISISHRVTAKTGRVITIA
ncbi:MAG: ABC transporter ATP-binding protein [Lachnospiraceae bacterium]